ncbi:MAG: hypothetical protein ACOX8U_05365 [Bradymonadia bacterium]|jgi:hypothetical protein
MKTHDNTVAAYSRKLALSLLQSSIIFFIIFALTMPNFALAQDSADSSELKSRQGWEFELGLSYLHTYKPEHNSDDQEWRMLECDGLLANLSFGYRFNPYAGFYFENDIGAIFVRVAVGGRGSIGGIKSICATRSRLRVITSFKRRSVGGCWA